MLGQIEVGRATGDSTEELPLNVSMLGTADSCNWIASGRYLNSLLAAAEDLSLSLSLC